MNISSYFRPPGTKDIRVEGPYASHSLIEGIILHVILVFPFQAKV